MGMHEATFTKFKKEGLFPLARGYDKFYDLGEVKKNLVGLNGLHQKNEVPTLSPQLTKSDLVDQIVNSGGVSAPRTTVKTSMGAEMEYYAQAIRKAGEAARDAYRQILLEAADAAKERGDLITEVMLLRAFALKDEELRNL